MNSQNPRPGMWELFRVWASIGLQSFGGGASTTYLIYHTFVEKRGWLSPEEYNQDWNLSVMAPGINLIGMTILIGRKMRGASGILVSLAGMLVPSAAITCLLTAGFLSVQKFPAVQAMLRGVVPATAGIMLVVGIKYAQPLLKEMRGEGKWQVVGGAAIVLLVALAIILWQVVIPLVLVGSVLVSILLFNRLLPRPRSVAIGTEKERAAEEIHD
jgi:chromate transporter